MSVNVNVLFTCTNNKFLIDFFVISLLNAGELLLLRAPFKVAVWFQQNLSRLPTTTHGVAWFGGLGNHQPTRAACLSGFHGSGFSQQEQKTQ